MSGRIANHRGMMPALALVVPLIVFGLAGCEESTLDGNGGGVTQFEFFNVDNGLADNWVTDIAVDYLRNGVWLTTKNGLSFFSNADSTFTTFGAETEIPDLEMTSVMVDFTGTVWVGTVTGAASLSLSDPVFRRFADVGNLPNIWITDIYRTNDTSLWFGTRGGIAVKKPSGWITYTSTLGASFDITSLALDNQNRVWAGSTGGITVFDNSSLISFGPTVLPSTYVNTVFHDQGLMWAGTATIAAAYDGLKWTDYGVVDGLPSTGVFRLERDTTGVLWAATSSGLFSLNGKRFEKLALPSEVSGAVVTSLANDAVQNVLWIGTESGAVRRHLAVK